LVCIVYGEKRRADGEGIELVVRVRTPQRVGDDEHGGGKRVTSATHGKPARPVYSCDWDSCK
jgi:hypothetical protein